MSKVVVLKTKPESVLNDYEELLDRVKINKIFDRKDEILFKLNLSWSLYYPACSTEPWQLEGVINGFKKYKLENIIPVENRTVVTDVWKGAKGNKWLPILKKYNLEYKPLTEAKWVKLKGNFDFDAIDHIFPDGLKVPEMFYGKPVVHLPTLKTHGHTQMTGAMKNAFGGLITERRHHSHKMIHEVLVDLLKIQQKIHPKMLAVMDGTVSGNGNGPRTMMPVESNLILASEDQVAIDAVAAKLMGFDPMKIKFIKMAHDYGLGNGDVDSLDIDGIDIKKINLKFSAGKSPVIFWDQMFRKGAFRFVEPMLFHTGLFNLAIFGSYFYHDKLWYPTVGKSRINKFMKTSWGEKFKEYES
ncbi:MAG: DUF362 domain-containing protein [Candidatus Nanoarchaeia archaeon]|nr:DUF362 domain-containing protein [Candidatus Nanoarchaeia archaeon]